MPADACSVIRVRVAGVTGPDALSRERVNAVAQQIEQRTGLDVDIVAGSSPSPVTIGLPAGRFGQPPLTLSENWVKKGVAVAILNAVDKTSVVLFTLILVVCVLFVGNAATAAVRGRRRELGVLAAVGWRRSRLFATVLGELAGIGLAAGLLAAAIAVPVSAGLGLSASPGTGAAGGARRDRGGRRGRPGAGLAGRPGRPGQLGPAAGARGPPRRTSPAGSPHWPLLNVARTPGRTLIGVVSLAIGIAALTLLTAVTVAFRGVVVGSLLGDAVAVQVRGVDYIAAGATVALGVLAVADVVFLNITERAAELATIRSFGWRDTALARLVITEGAIIGVTGSLAGAAARAGSRRLVRRAAARPAAGHRSRRRSSRDHHHRRGRAAARRAAAPPAPRPPASRGVTDMAASAPGSGALELRGVCKRYGTGQGGQVTAADNVTFTIEAGAFVALTGASGSGKSTMLHMIGAIERPDSGVIISNGTEVTALRGAAQADYRRTVGFVFQRYNLLPGLTALDNVIAPVLPYRTRWDKRDRARQLLAAVGLAGRERSLPARMSGGEQQRIAIARALINTPALLLADEPTGNLDSANATEHPRPARQAPRRTPHDNHARLPRPADRRQSRTADPAPRRRSHRRHPAHRGPPGTGRHPAHQPARLTNPKLGPRWALPERGSPGCHGVRSRPLRLCQAWLCGGQTPDHPSRSRRPACASPTMSQ